MKKEKLAFVKCLKCKDLINFDTGKNLVCCSYGIIAVDGCKDYTRIIDNENDFELIEKMGRGTRYRKL